MDRFLFELDLVGRFAWALHNLVAHPLMVFLPRTWGDWVHNVTTPAE